MFSFDYFYILAVTNCNDSPCQNGATCNDTGMPDGNYTCICVTGWKSPNCDQGEWAVWEVGASCYDGGSYFIM